MSKAVFQSGMSWQVVNAKWARHQRSIPQLRNRKSSRPDPRRAETNSRKTNASSENRRKLAAIAHNAQRIIELDAEHGCFIDYLRSPRRLLRRSQRPQKAIQIPRRHRMLLLPIRNRRTSPTPRRMDVRARTRQTTPLIVIPAKAEI